MVNRFRGLYCSKPCRVPKRTHIGQCLTIGVKQRSGRFLGNSWARCKARCNRSAWVFIVQFFVPVFLGGVAGF